MKIAVILFNLGGPDSLNNVKPFLFNLFKDPAIIALPKIFRFMLAYFISSRRTKFAQEIYAQMGGKSTILSETKLQAKALEQKLNFFDKKNKGKDKDNSYKVFISMRYWHPMANEIIKKVKNYNPTKIILVPLYPQYSTTTTFSSIKEWVEASASMGLSKPTSLICCYPDNENFIAAYSDLILKEYKKAQSIKKS